jgi:hypothetical protein
MEPLMEGIVRNHFHNSRFVFRTGRGQTGPDVEWVGGEDPGFDIADFKPDTPSGYSKFVTQVRSWGAKGWRGRPNPPPRMRAAYIAYQLDGTIYVGDIGIVGP